MPGVNFTVFEQLRPPIAIDNHGRSPLRLRRADEIFSLADRNFVDRQGQKITRKLIIQHQTDSGHLVDNKWNSRHHVSPSTFNLKNNCFFKVSLSLKLKRVA